MLRAKAFQQADGQKSARSRVTDKALAKADLVGSANSGPIAPLVNKALGTPGSGLRKVVAKVVGIHEERILPPYARTRFSTWFARHTPRLGRPKQGDVAVFPTCLVEYADTQVGRDLVGVYERNGLSCSMPDGLRCCGAPALHQGDLPAFRKDAAHNVAILADAIRDAEARGEDLTVVVPEPTCGYVLKADYVDYLGTEDAQLVADHTRDAAEHLVAVHKDPDTELDTEFTGDVPEKVVYHAPRSHEAHRRQDHRRGRVLGHRRHLGPALGELRRRPSGRRQDGQGHRQGRCRRRRRRLLPGQRRHPPGDRPDAPAPPVGGGPRLRHPHRRPLTQHEDPPCPS
jgi:hypothetical protein